MGAGPSEEEKAQDLRLTAYRASENFWYSDEKRKEAASTGDLIHTAAAVENYLRTGRTEFSESGGGDYPTADKVFGRAE